MCICISSDSPGLSPVLPCRSLAVRRSSFTTPKSGSINDSGSDEDSRLYVLWSFR